MAISDYIPNIFGSAAPTSYESLQTLGLITPQQVAQQQNTANIQGLLGAGLALAQGMSRVGPRRSAAENILSALAGGFGAAGGAYQQGIQNVVQQQQLQGAALQQQQAANKIRSLERFKQANPTMAGLVDLAPDEAVKQMVAQERSRMYGFGPPTGQQPTEMMPQQVEMTQPEIGQQQGSMPANQVQGQIPGQDPRALATAAAYRQKAALAISLGDKDTAKFFQDEADRIDPKEQLFFRDGRLISSKRGELANYGGGKVLTDAEATQLGLDPTRGKWSIKDNIPSLVSGTSSAKLLTKDQASQLGLPTDRNQIYQQKPDGNIDLVQGSMKDIEKFSGEYGNVALDMFGTSDISQLTPTQRRSVGQEAERRGNTKAEKGAPKVFTGDLSKPTVSQVEQGVLSDAAAVTRLNNIQFSYKPEYQNIKFRTGQAWNTLRDKFGTLPDTEKRQLTEYSQYKQNALQNLNQTIKDITGAAMGVQEADRIIASLPNAGTDIFSGDSPTEFEAKLNNAVKQTKYALARKNYALKSGLKWENTSLDSMPSIINNRGAAIAKQYNLDPKKPADLQTINRQLAAEFGIAF